MPSNAKSPTVRQDELDFVHDARTAVMGDRVAGANLLLWSITTGLIALVVWASRAELEEVTKGSGKVIPSSSLQTIQNLEGGILSEIRVREGLRVAKGDVLVRIDDTLTQSSFREDLARQEALMASYARLQAEAEDAPEPAFPDDLTRKRPDLIERERRLFQERTKDLSGQRTALSESLRLARQELDLTIPLVEREVMPKVDQIRLERQVVELEGELNKLTTGFRREAWEQANKALAEIEQLEEKLSGGEDRVQRTIVRSPTSGTVNHLHIKTIGGVIQPGEAIVDIVPDDDTLLVEAKIRPSDIAFIRPDQEATVKFTAYDFALYGGLKGRVEHISADTIQDEIDQEHYYIVKVRNRAGKLVKDGEELPIIPGMIAEVDVLTGKRTVLQYLLKPFHRMRHNALRER